MKRRDRRTKQATVSSSVTERPPAQFRHFIYLDSDEVLNALSAVQGGAIDEAVDEVVRAGGSNVGFSLKVGGQGLQAGAKNSTQIKNSLTRRQTTHAAIAALLYTLRQQIKHLPIVNEGFEENDLVQFDCDCCYAISTAAKRPDANGEFALTPPGRWRRLVGLSAPLTPLEGKIAASGIGHAFVALAATKGGTSIPFVLRMKSEHLLVEPAEFSRRVTVVGQIAEHPEEDEQTIITADANGTTASVVPAPDSSTNELVNQLLAVGLVTDDPRWKGIEWPQSPRWLEHIGEGWNEAAIVRPLCIFK